MGWFNRWNRKEDPIDIEKDDKKLKYLAAVRHWKPIGSSFMYLGRTCLVCEHERYVGAGLSIRRVSDFSADYTDNNGIIRRISFGSEEVLALMRADGVDISEFEDF